MTMISMGRSEMKYLSICSGMTGGPVPEIISQTSVGLRLSNIGVIELCVVDILFCNSAIAAFDFFVNSGAYDLMT